MKLIYSTSRTKIEFHEFFLSENSQILAYVAELFITKSYFSFFSGQGLTSIGKTASDLLKKPSQFMVSLKIVAMRAYKF